MRHDAEIVERRIPDADDIEPVLRNHTAAPFPLTRTMLPEAEDPGNGKSGLRGDNPCIATRVALH
jgi:hypothetical protein